MSGKAKSRGPLTADDWVQAALEVLVDEGAAGLRVAHVARRLGVTSGSFYWHFRDRKHLRDKMLRRWLQALQDAASTAEGAGEGRAKLAALPRVLNERRLPELDEAMREWARTDPSIARAVRRADALRIRRVEALLRAAGLDDATAARRAPLMLYAHVGSIGADRRQREGALAELGAMLVSPPQRRRR